MVPRRLHSRALKHKVRLIMTSIAVPTHDQTLESATQLAPAAAVKSLRSTEAHLFTFFLAQFCISLKNPPVVTRGSLLLLS